MHTHRETRFLPYTPAQLFGLVADVEKYSEFLPWCRGARILERGEGYFVAELIISFSHLTERYTSRVDTKPPTDNTEGTIEVSLVRGPFSTLANHWRFVPQGQGCDIHFAVDFQFKSKLLDKLIGNLFTRATEKMIGAFTARAEALYGSR